MKTVISLLMLIALPVLAGDRYLYVELPKDATAETKEEFRKWVLSLPKENWHDVAKWDTKDTNQVWSVNLDVEKPGSPWKPLTATTQTVATAMSKATEQDKSKIVVEAHSATPTKATAVDLKTDPKTEKP